MIYPNIMSRQKRKKAAVAHRSPKGHSKSAGHRRVAKARAKSRKPKAEVVFAPSLPVLPVPARVAALTGEASAVVAAPSGTGTGGEARPPGGFDLSEKIKELVRLAQEQGYLTYNDINDALPDAVVTADDLDEVYTRLRNLDVEIVDQAEVDRIKQPEPEEEDEKARLDILDDPVRTDQQWVAREGRKALIGGVAVAGGPQRQHLPQALAGAVQKVDEAKGCVAQVADAVAAGKRGGMQQNA